MISASQVALGAVASIAIAFAAQAQPAGTDFSKIRIETQKIAPNLYLLSGSSGLDANHEDAAGGRIGVLAGPDGVLMVDAQYAELAGKVAAAVRKISPAPIRILVNTHIHIDHTGGNPYFGKLGATIYAREELRDEMIHLPRRPDGRAPTPRDAAGYPVVTYGMEGPVTIHMNGETVDFIPVRAAHTGGDTMVRFEKANVILIGDFYRNYGYPFIDTANGGSLKGMLDACDMLLKLAKPDTKLVPGHGTIITRDAIVPYREMIGAVQAKVRTLVAEGKSEKEVVAAKVTAPFDSKTAGGTDASADRFVSEVYEELKRGG